MSPTGIKRMVGAYWESRRQAMSDVKTAADCNPLPKPHAADCAVALNARHECSCGVKTERDAFTLAIWANNGEAKVEFNQRNCTCDASVGHCPCQYCAIHDALTKAKHQQRELVQANARIKELEANGEMFLSGELAKVRAELADFKKHEPGKVAELFMLRKENEELREWKQSVCDAHKEVMGERCPDNEVHCTCVPVLMAENAKLMKVVEELEHFERRRLFETCPNEGSAECNLWRECHKNKQCQRTELLPAALADAAGKD
jgi:hypothetical protein